MPDAPDPLTLDDLIAWGRDYEQLLRISGTIHLPRPMLDQFIAAAIEALMQQRERDSKKPRSRGGRPKGGMGEQYLRLIEAGVRPEDAKRTSARAFGKPPEAVRRAEKSARKKRQH